MFNFNPHKSPPNLPPIQSVSLINMLCLEIWNTAYYIDEY